MSSCGEIGRERGEERDIVIKRNAFQIKLRSCKKSIWWGIA
jgi:hypothetical protein